MAEMLNRPGSSEMNQEQPGEATKQSAQSTALGDALFFHSQHLTLLSRHL
jgi:hypothetical protein